MHLVTEQHCDFRFTEQFLTGDSDTPTRSAVDNPGSYLPKASDLH